MVDRNFYTNKGAFTLQQLSDEFSCKVANNVYTDIKLFDVAALNKASISDISFLDNPKYKSDFQLIEQIENELPYDKNTGGGSVSDFFLYKKTK